MKPAPFAYVAPRTVEEAVAALVRFDGEARVLAGGQSLVPLMNLRMARPAALVDLGRVQALDYIRLDGDRLAIGAMTRQSSAEHSDLVRRHCPLMRRTMPYLGHPTIRNRGTIGGTLCHADRVAELPAVAVALEAELVAVGPQGRRTILAGDFFVGDLTNALRRDEVLVEARFPIAQANSRSAFVEAANRHHDLAIVGVAAELNVTAGRRCTNARIAAIGAASRPARLKQVEARLQGEHLSPATITEAARLSLDGVAVEGDLHASAAYRRRVLPGLVERAINQALASD